MTTRPPPIPPQNRSDKGVNVESPPDTKPDKDNEAARNLHQQGRHGNVKQNTTHQGYQQDR
jgi:hypothetical protein